MSAAEKLYLVSLLCGKNWENLSLRRNTTQRWVCAGAPSWAHPTQEALPWWGGGQPRTAQHGWPHCLRQVLCAGRDQAGRKWAPLETSRSKSCCHPEGRRIGTWPPVSHPAAQGDMLLRGRPSSAAAAVATVWTLEHGSRAGQELPVCEGDVDEKLFSFFPLLLVHFLGMNQLDFCP